MPTNDASRFPFVRTVVERQVVDSTSTLARHLVEDGGVALPLLVRAESQTAGRGRGDRSWWSDRGSLMVTVALDPAMIGLRREHEPRVALMTAVAVIDTLTPYLPFGSAGIRWPNDVEIADRKLGGILPERVETSEGPRLLIGIGLNLTNRLQDAPDEIRAMATTLQEERTLQGPPIQTDVILRELLRQLARRLKDLARDEPNLAERWSSLDTLRGRFLRIQQGSEIWPCRGAGITAEGALRTLTDDGRVRIFHGGTVLRSPLPDG